MPGGEDVVHEPVPDFTADGLDVDMLHAMAAALRSRHGVDEQASVTLHTHTRDASNIRTFADDRIVVNVARGVITADGQDLPFPNKERIFLETVTSDVGAYFRFSTLMRVLYGDEVDRRGNLDVVVHKVRRGFQDVDPALWHAISTRRGFGYAALSSLPGRLVRD